MAAEPGEVSNYSSGVIECFAYIFQKETGEDVNNSARNIYLRRWGSGANGSVRIWEWSTRKAACTERERPGEDRLLVSSRRDVNGQRSSRVNG